MATCPLCLYSNPPETGVCARCGKFRFPTEVPERVAAGGMPVEMHTQIVAQIHHAVDAIDESARRTIRGPITVSKSSVQSSVATVAATAVASDSDAYSVVSIETTPEPLAPATPQLVVIRGERMGAEFPIYNGKNFMGRSADKPVDIDLTGQEASEQVWSSRQHAVVIYDRGMLLIEDLNSLNGTFVNRSRLHPGQQRVLQSNDVIQVGTVQFKVTM